MKLMTWLYCIVLYSVSVLYRWWLTIKVMTLPSRWWLSSRWWLTSKLSQNDQNDHKTIKMTTKRSKWSQNDQNDQTSKLISMLINHPNRPQTGTRGGLRAPKGLFFVDDGWWRHHLSFLSPSSSLSSSSSSSYSSFDDSTWQEQRLKLPYRRLQDIDIFQIEHSNLEFSSKFNYF